MPQEHAVSDAQLSRTLGVYAGMVHRVLIDPGRWLGLDPAPGAGGSVPRRLLRTLRSRTVGRVSPASAGWAQQPLQKRVDWWVTRIGLSDGLAAAAPRFAGALADRVPLQAALGASAAGIAVCATAREHGITDAKAWVPLLAKVLLDRDLAVADASVPPPAESEQRLDEAAEADDDEPTGPLGTLGRGALSAGKTLWGLARALFAVDDMLDERPRGSMLARGLAKIPAVGLAAGWLDERGGIRKAAEETSVLIAARS